MKPSPPKSYFQWREPKAVWKVKDAFKVAMCLALLIGFVLILQRFNPAREPLPFLEILGRSLSFGALIIILVWLSTRIPIPSEVHLYDEEIASGPGGVWSRKIKYKVFGSFSWGVGSDSAVLILKARSRFKSDTIVRVPLEISREAVSAFLIERHLTPEEDLTSIG